MEILRNTTASVTGTVLMALVNGTEYDPHGIHSSGGSSSFMGHCHATVPIFLNLFILSSALSYSNSGNSTLFSMGHHSLQASELQLNSKSDIFWY